MDAEIVTMVCTTIIGVGWLILIGFTIWCIFNKK